MVKIAFLTEEITKNGGISRVVNLWANHFSEIGYSTTVIATKTQPAFYEYKKNVNIRNWLFVYRLKLFAIPFNVLSTYVLAKRLPAGTNLIIDRAIHIEPIWFLRKIGLLKNINIIYFLHGGTADFNNFYKKRLLYKHKTYMVFDAFDIVVCLHNDGFTGLTANQIKKIHIIPNPLPFERVDISSRKSNTILYVGRLDFGKGIDKLIGAWSELEKDYTDWNLLIVGDGPDKNKLIKIAENMQLNNVKFVIGTPDVKKFYTEAKIFCLPTTYDEGMPMVILEAMACNCCVVTSASIGCINIVKNNINGFVTNVYSQKSFADDLKHLIDCPDVRKRLANSGYLFANDFSIQRISDRWNKVFLA